MTLTRPNGRPEPCIGIEWITQWVDDIDVDDVATAAIEAYADEGTAGEVRLRSLASGSEEIIAVDEFTENLLMPSIDAGAGIVEISGRVTSGEGLLWVTRAALNLGPVFRVDPDVVTPVEILGTVTDVTVVEGDTLRLFPPSHTGGAIYGERSFDGGATWTPMGAYDKSPADDSDAGLYRWRAVRGIEEHSIEYTVTVTQPTQQSVTVVSNPTGSIDLVEGQTFSIAGLFADAATWLLAIDTGDGFGPAGPSGTGNNASWTSPPQTVSAYSYRFTATGFDGSTASTEPTLVTVTAPASDGLLVTDTEETWS